MRVLPPSGETAVWHVCILNRFYDGGCGPVGIWTQATQTVCSECMCSLTTVKVLYPSSIGLYPVQRHRLPERPMTYKEKCFPDVQPHIPLCHEVYTLKSLLYIGHFGCGVVSQQSVHGHDNSRSTETALRAMSFCHSLLNTRAAAESNAGQPHSLLPCGILPSLMSASAVHLLCCVYLLFFYLYRV